jgi:carboxyl-terminal processing protease
MKHVFKKSENKKEIKKDNKKSKTKKEKKNLFQTSEVVILTIVTCTIGIIMGYLVGTRMNKKDTKEYSSDLQEFIKNYEYIVDNKIADVSSTDLIKGAIEGMLSTFEDDYSYVIDEEEQENFNIRLMGEYEGVGVEIVSTTDGQIYIYTVFEDSPAEKAGLKVGDEIIKVDGESTSEKTSTDIANYIKTSEKSSFDITVSRSGEEMTFTVTREKVIINSVASRVIEKDDKKIGYIYLSIFSASSYEQFKEKLEELEKQNIDSLIIDVRYNNGGHLTTATNILSLFLDSSNIIYQTDKDGEIEKFYSTGKETKTYPIVVLQNSSSASASEMLSAALKEQYGAKVVGETSFGKGTVQELITLSDGTEYKFTTKKWLTPKGNWINETGVAVDYEVELDDAYFEDPTDENDSQLQKAIEVLIKGE